jgi:DNA-binding response OmpR family regulator
MMKTQILIVAEDASQQRTLGALAHHEWHFESVPDCEAAYRMVLAGRFRVVVIDLASRLDGIELIKQIRATSQSGKTLVLVIGEWGTGQTTFALSQGADACEVGPVDAARLLNSVEKLLQPHAVVLQ